MVAGKILFILVLINSVPLFLAVLFPKAGRRPLDNHQRLKDGWPVLGSHKTVSGFFSGVLAGVIGAAVVGFPLWAGLTAGLLGMIGDSLSSFIKRRLNAPEGTDFPVLDHVFESGFPLLFFHFLFALDRLSSAGILTVFILGGWAITGVREKLFSSPKGSGIRCVRSTNRFRQWRACHTALSPFARWLNFENVIYYRWIMGGLFRGAGIYEKGVANALDVRVKEITLRLSRFPKSFGSYRILFISDLHIDGLDPLAERLISLVSRIDADICLLGGDYRMDMYGPFFKVSRKLRDLVGHIRAKDGVYGVLGNHDCIELAPELEQVGIYMLINDAVSIHKNGAVVNIAGVDDPHYYKCHSLRMAYENISSEHFSILVSHSPEIIKDIDGYPVDLCLCGHTHGGQIRLPGIGAVFTHCRTRREFTSGLWHYKGTAGYTTSGAGASGVPVRFNCPPEVVLVTLNGTAEAG